ncbi:MAG: hypothetical protein R2863_10640 [Candidatus Kapaibacterium sp.]
MKKNLILFQIVILSLVLMAGSCSESTNPDSEVSYLDLKVNDFWNYDVFSVDENGNTLMDEVSKKSIRLIDSEVLDSKTGFSLRIEPETNNEFFTHISADEVGIFLYMGEIDLNQYATDPNIKTQIQILIPGWIKIMDYKNNEWESFFVELNRVIEQDTVYGKLQINGKKLDKKEITYSNKTYMADVVKITLDLSAKVTSPDSKIDESATSEIIYTFIEGIGIYSVEQKLNPLLGINQNTLEILTSNGNMGTP